MSDWNRSFRANGWWSIAPTRSTAVQTQSSIRRSVLVLVEFNSDRAAGLAGRNKSSLLVRVEFNSDRAARLAANNEEVRSWQHATRY